MVGRKQRSAQRQLENAQRQRPYAKTPMDTEQNKPHTLEQHLLGMAEHVDHHDGQGRAIPLVFVARLLHKLRKIGRGQSFACVVV